MISFKYFINEMAINRGGGISMLSCSKSIRNSEYEENNDGDHVSHPLNTTSIELQKNTITHPNGNITTKYHTNDHNSKETLHRAVIKQHQPSKELPFKHEEQSEVDRFEGGDLPKGYATNVIYNHFKNSGLPLRSSDEQFKPGHKLWNRLAHKAMDDGHHVYHHDGKSLIKSTPETIDDHLEKSFGKGDEFKNKHMIISKTKLKGN